MYWAGELVISMNCMHSSFTTASRRLSVWGHTLMFMCRKFIKSVTAIVNKEYIRFYYHQPMSIITHRSKIFDPQQPHAAYVL